MKKLILEFSDDEVDHEGMKAINGWRYSLALHNMHSSIRSLVKYSEQETINKDDLMREFCEHLANVGLSTEDII